MTEPKLSGRDKITHFIHHVTGSGRQRRYATFYGKTPEEFVEEIKTPSEGGVYYIVKRVETIKETIIKSIPNK